MDSYTTILLVETLKLLKAGYNRHLYWEVWEAQMASFDLLRELACREPTGRWLCGLVQLAKWFLCGFCSMSATKEPVQPYNLVSRRHLPFQSVTTCPPSTPTSHPLVSTHDTTLACATGQIFYLVWWKTLKTANKSS